jgi:hypothetical protein
VDPRARWQTLQAQLTTARQRLEDGDRIAALEAIEAALAIDPDFLAAHALRDRVHAGDVPAPRPLVAPTSIDTPVPPVTAPAEPLVSTERYASFEQRTRRRRVDRRLDAARLAIASGHVRDAESALDEVRELDPNVPDLVELAPMLEALQRGHAAPHRGRWVAAAAAFLIVVAGATWMQETRSLRSRPFVAVAPLVAPDSTVATTATADTPSVPVVATSGQAADAPVNTTPTAAPPSALPPAPLSAPAPSSVVPIATEAMRADVVRTEPPRSDPPRLDLPRADAPSIEPRRDARTDAVRTDALRSDAIRNDVVRTDAVVRASEREPIARSADVVPADASKSANATAPMAAAAPAPLSIAPNPVAAPAPPPPAPVPAAAPPPPANTSSVAPVAAVPARPNDELLVNQALQRYRKAYEGLDAPSAHAVWPAVNEAALARAFDGLQSQTLTFDTCDVNVKGVAAAATCRGSARYVRKIGSHDPLVEPRTWSFTLRKDGEDWKIESARANR